MAEPNIFTTFQKASFNGITFPVSQITVKGGIRHHVHEFPHSAGGDPEKMGRKLYTVRFRAHFHALPGTDMEREYPNLYPAGLTQLRAWLDLETTADLVIPNVGTIKAFGTDWTQTADLADALTGETLELEFLEDQDKAALAEGKGSSNPAKVTAANDDLQAKAALLDYKKTAKTGLFQAINDAVTAVDGALGLADASNRLVAGKLNAVADLCSRADAEIEAFQDPINHEVLEALKALWAAAADLAEDIPGVAATILTYRVPTVMSIGQVSTAIYGTSDRAVELLQLNPITDAFAIPVDTQVKYFEKGLAA